MATVQVEESAGHARYTYRLRVSSTALALLQAEWGRCRWVWNECVAMSKKRHQANRARPAGAPKVTCGPAELDRMLTEARAANAWLREGASVPQQQTVRDFAKSRAKAQKDMKAKLPVGQRAGMPRHKKLKDARPSLNYTRRRFRIRGGRLHLAGGIVLTVVWSQQLPADPSSARVYQDSLGHWYVSFVVPAQLQPLPHSCLSIGIDWGVAETATTTSDAHDLPHPQHGRNAAAALARYQRQMSRRRPPKGQPASKGYRRAQQQAARAHKKVARQRQDTGRKWAKSVVRDHQHIAVEDFRPGFLAKTTMARKAADGAICATKTALQEMARKHGRSLYLVNPAHTTMDCAHCGARAKHRMPLSVRTYICTTCGASCPRDKNSARVMLHRAGLNPAGVECVGRGCLQGSRAARARNSSDEGGSTRPPGGEQST
ncbi:RNA-guided endonuclease InsQ/TnpB family protein [Kitasatospora acidiphila]|uniref:RNA-guided endonuclease InsQ/TnpB family protein n=1 Tax=Kitasatospora acidiphila TaxID=2567942 RepID=UPI001E59CC27|nr:transposase [Kitasatospora acidiphila]